MTEMETYEEETYSPDTSSDDSSDEITYEQALAWKKKADEAEAERARRIKAEEALVGYKKAAKVNKSDTSEPSGYVTKQELELEKFISRNPELEEWKDEIAKHLSRGLNINEARVLVENSEPVVNKKKTAAMSVSFSEGEPSKTVFTMDELANMSQTDYNRVRDLMEKGKVTIR